MFEEIKFGQLQLYVCDEPSVMESNSTNRSTNA